MSNAQYGSQLYDTERQALVACCQDYVSAGGKNTADDVADMWLECGADGLVKDMLADEWQVPGEDGLWSEAEIASAMEEACSDYIDEIIH